MFSPIHYGIASIVPGLGFLLLNTPRKALGAILLVVIPVITYFIVNDDYKRFFLLLIIVTWLGQMYAAYDTANVFLAFKLDPQSKHMTELEMSVTALHRTFLNWLKDPKNTILYAVIMGTYFVDRKPGIVFQFPAGLRYLGLTDDQFIIIDLDYTGKPKSIKRYSREMVDYIQVRRGLLTDRVSVKVGEETFHLNVSIYLRDQTKVFSGLQSQK